MRKIPLNHKKIIDSDPYFKICARKNDGNCGGRITIEHAWIYAGKQISEIWAYVPLCWYHHLGSGMEKDKNEFISLRHATSEDLAKYPKRNWEQRKNYLQQKYGKKVIGQSKS